MALVVFGALDINFLQSEVNGTQDLAHEWHLPKNVTPPLMHKMAG
jgi:hypothetical protein